MIIETSMLILIDADEISLKEILQSNLENYGKCDIGQKRRFFERRAPKISPANTFSKCFTSKFNFA